MRASEQSAESTIRGWPEQSGVSDAREERVRGHGVLVGVLDTGIDADHSEFSHRLVTYRYVSLFPFSPYWPSRDVRGFDPTGTARTSAGSSPAAVSELRQR